MQVHNYREILQNTHRNWRKFDVVFYLYTLKRNPTAFDLNWFIFIQSDFFLRIDINRMKFWLMDYMKIHCPTKYLYT